MEEYIYLIFFVGICLVLMMILFYIYIKDLESNKKLKMYEKSIEDLNKELFKLQKKIKEKEIEENSSINRVEFLVKSTLKKELDRVEVDISKDIESRFDAILDEIDGLKCDFDGRIYSVDDKIKELGYIPSSSNGADDGNIISMHSNGFSIDDIAKELRIPKGEVEFTLKLAKYK